MTRTAESIVARRINGTRRWLQRVSSDAMAVTALIKHYGVSRRQAYRYLQAAKTSPALVSIPEKKVTLSIKVPLRLARSLRQMARSMGVSLSALITQALEAFLPRR